MIRFFVLFFFILTTISFAEIKKVNIVGNSRVNSNTIETLVDKKITNVDSIFINNLTKKIYDTEFFSDVKISYNQDLLTITVVENPIVNFFYIGYFSKRGINDYFFLPFAGAAACPGFGLLAPYLERLCVLPFTPAVSKAPRTM